MIEPGRHKHSTTYTVCLIGRLQHYVLFRLMRHQASKSTYPLSVTYGIAGIGKPQLKFGFALRSGLCCRPMGVNPQTAYTKVPTVGSVPALRGVPPGSGSKGGILTEAEDQAARREREFPLKPLRQVRHWCPFRSCPNQPTQESLAGIFEHENNDASIRVKFTSGCCFGSRKWIGWSDVIPLRD